jgi:hypothetical protein
MKKLVLIGLMGLVAGTTNANQWQEQPLAINNEMPQQMGEPVKAQPVRMEQNNYNGASGYSVAFGYAGSKIGSNNLGGDEEFNGFFLNGTADLNSRLSMYAEYQYQDASDMDFNEVAVGMQYQLMESGNAYTSAGIGLGYAWLDESGYVPDLDANVNLNLEYITLPINFEVGYKMSPNLNVFANFGYKWFFNNDAEVCSGGICVSGDSSDLDVDGVTYKAGLRYNF